MPELDRRWCPIGAMPCHGGGKSTSRSEQEVPAPARGVYNRELEKRLRRAAGVCGNSALEHGVQGSVEQQPHERLRGIVAPRCPAGVPAARVRCREAELVSALSYLRDQLQQTLVHTSQLLGPHVAPVHARESAVLAEPGQTEDRQQQRSVLKLRLVEVGALRFVEEPAQRGKAETSLAARHAAENNLQSVPEVTETVVSAPAHRSVAQPANTVPLCVKCLRTLGGSRIVKYASLLHGQQEDQAVHEPEQLLEECVSSDRPGLETGAQRLVPRMREEALSECDKGVLHALP